MGQLNQIDYHCNVVEAAEKRIVHLFETNKVVCFSTSGGKDSICTADVLIKAMQKNGISFSRLFVIFFDEEAMHEDVIEIAMEQRQRFLQLGAKFYWFCLPIRHWNCCSKLQDDESFLCWEPGKEDKWVRKMPPFAIRMHKDFKWGQTYQYFCKAVFKNIPIICGLRMAESVQRRGFLTQRKNGVIYSPIYDWNDNDVWLYIYQNNLRFPQTYIHLYKIGVHRNKLRISQFFALDTVKTLPRLLEFDGSLSERILRREPNAELAFLYWDTPMFRSNGDRAKMGEEEHGGKDIDYKSKLLEAIKVAPSYPEMYPGYTHVMYLFSKMGEHHSQNLYRDLLQILVSGDPKQRHRRVLAGRIQAELRGEKR